MGTVSTVTQGAGDEIALEVNGADWIAADGVCAVSLLVWLAQPRVIQQCALCEADG